MKQKLAAVVRGALALLVSIGLGVWYYDSGESDRTYGPKMEARREAEKASLAALRQASPDPLARLTEHGVNLTHNASLVGGALRLEYRLSTSSPTIQAVPFTVAGEPSPRLYDPATGKNLGQFRQGSHSTRPHGPTVGEARFEGVPGLPDGAEVQLPLLLVYSKPDRELSWEVRRPGEQGEAVIGERFSIGGAEFEVERVRFEGDRVDVEYRQLNDPARVGFHLLTFRLSDRMGGVWGGDYPLRQFPDPHRPSQSFDLLPSLSKTWSVQVQHAVLALPGPTIPVEVK